MRIMLPLLLSALLPAALQAENFTEERHIFPGQKRTNSTSRVMLPPGYETSGLRYPVMVLLPGSGGSPGQNMCCVPGTLLDLELGDMLPVILVAPDRRGFSREDYLRHVVREVIPFVDAQYRTIPRREARATMGFSLGGGEAIELGLRYPDTFSLIGTHGTDQLGTFPALLQAHAQHRFPLEFWNYRGTSDNLARPLGPLVDLLNQLALPNTHVEDDEGHWLHNNGADSYTYFSQRLWENANASDPIPVRRLTRRFSATAGAATTLNIEVDLDLNRADAPPALTLDGTAIGLAADLPLTHQGDGRYTARLDFTAPPLNTVYKLPLRRQIGSADAEAFHWIRLEVLPQTQHAIADDQWLLSLIPVTLGPDTDAEAFVGPTSLGVTAEEGLTIRWEPTEAIPAFGYSLRFAFHPGTARGTDLKLLYSASSTARSFAEWSLLNGEAGRSIDLDRPEWQVVEIPLDSRTNSADNSSHGIVFSDQTLAGLRFVGDIAGTFYLDDVRLVPQTPSTPAAVTFPPALRFAGGTADLPVVVDDIPAAVDIELRAESRVDDLHPALRLDGTAIGADATVALTANGNGRYTARLPLDQTLPNGIYRLPVLMDSERHGTELFAALRLMVYPDTERVVYAESDLSADITAGRSFLVGLDPQATAEVFAGQTSLAIQGKVAALTRYLIWAPEQPTFGYDLHLTFHPGQIEGSGDPAEFKLRIADAFGLENEVPLIGAEAPLDLQQQAWQTAKIPLGDQPIQSITIEGNLKGTFYLDDLRLVPQTPPPLPTAVAEQHQDTTPDDFDLDQNYPNPFNSGTVIRFTLPQADDIRLTVFNLAGQRVADLINGPRAAGAYTVHWDGRDAQGKTLASGLYLYQLRAGANLQTRKLTLLR